MNVQDTATPAAGEGLPNPSTPGEVRSAWWHILGLIEALEIVSETADGLEGRNALDSVVRALRGRSRAFSRLVESVADGRDHLDPGDRDTLDIGRAA